jgi:RHS repeat-associated protein
MSTHSGANLQNLIYTYSNVGNITQMVDSVAVETMNYSYDIVNRLTRMISGTLNENYSYSNNGNLSTKGTVNLSYNASVTCPGGTRSIPHAVSSAGSNTYAYDCNGNMTTRNVGSTYTLSYDAENRLTGVSGPITDTYSYDGDGNRVKSANDYVNLASGLLPTSDGTLYFPSAATNGDTWAESGMGSSGEFTYISEAGLHYLQIDLGASYAVDKINVWHYDSDGRTYHNTKTQVSTDGQTWTTVYDSAVSGEYQETAAGKTISFTGRNVRYVRDYVNGSNANSGNHWVEIQVWGRTSTTYIGNYLEWIGSTASMKKYYYAGSTRIAQRTGIGSGVTGLFWLLGDHLGSTSVTLDAASGAKTTELRYKPWGENRFTSGLTPTMYQFTGQRMDSYNTDGLASQELYLMGSRYYDPYLNRWCQPDQIIPDPGNPQSWDRYAYVQNNPVRYTDPTGHAECEGWRCGSASDDLDTAKAYEAKVNSMDYSEYHGWLKEYLSTVAAYHYARAQGAPPEVQDTYVALMNARHSALVLNGFNGRDAALDTAVRVTPPESFVGIANAAAVIVPGMGGVYSIKNNAGIVVRVGRTNDLSSREGDYYRDPNYFDLNYKIEWQTDDYATQRGLEQYLFDKYQPPMNVIRPIGPRNNNGTNYFNAALDYLKEFFGGL